MTEIPADPFGDVPWPRSADDYGAPDLDASKSNGHDKGEEQGSEEGAGVGPGPDPAAPSSPPLTPVAPAKLRLLTTRDLEDEKPRDYIVKGLISRGDHAIIAGAPSSGKSAIGPLIGYRVALGQPFMGMRVRQGRVLYIASEDGAGAAQRFRALCARFGHAPDFRLISQSVDLLSEDGDGREIESVIHSWQPLLVFMDTIAKTFPNLRENDADGMGLVINTVRRLSLICGSAIVSIHHVAKNGGETPRGHGSLNADADVTIMVTGAGADIRSVSLGKNRSGPSDKTFAFRIEGHSFGRDEDGDEITAPIACEVEDVNALPAEDRIGKRLNDRQEIMRRMALEMIRHESVERAPAVGMSNTIKCVSRQLFQDKLFNAGWFDVDEISPVREAGQPYALTKAGHNAVTNALRALKRWRGLEHNREWIWWPKKEPT
jgi:AAA domain